MPMTETNYEQKDKSKSSNKHQKMRRFNSNLQKSQAYIPIGIKQQESSSRLTNKGNSTQRINTESLEAAAIGQGSTRNVVFHNYVSSQHHATTKSLTSTVNLLTSKKSAESNHRSIDDSQRVTSTINRV